MPLTIITAPTTIDAIHAAVLTSVSLASPGPVEEHARCRSGSPAAVPEPAPPSGEWLVPEGTGPRSRAPRHHPGGVSHWLKRTNRPARGPARPACAGAAGTRS